MALERWIIVAFVAFIFASVGILGWHFTQPRTTDGMCATAAAQCLDRPYFGSP